MSFLAIYWPLCLHTVDDIDISHVLEVVDSPLCVAVPHLPQGLVLVPARPQVVSGGGGGGGGGDVF